MTAALIRWGARSSATALRIHTHSARSGSGRAKSLAEGGRASLPVPASRRAPGKTLPMGPLTIIAAQAEPSDQVAGGVPIAVEKEKRRIFSVSWSSPTVPPPWEGRTERRYADGQHATARGCEQAGLADRGRGGDANCGAERH